MRYTDLKGPVANFRSGELEESYPEAHKAFLDDFLCSISMVDFAVDAKASLWAFVAEDEVYLWQPSWKAADGTVAAGTWMDRSDLKD